MATLRITRDADGSFWVTKTEDKQAGFGAGENLSSIDGVGMTPVSLRRS